MMTHFRFEGALLQRPGVQNDRVQLPGLLHAQVLHKLFRLARELESSQLRGQAKRQKLAVLQPRHRSVFGQADGSVRPEQQFRMSERRKLSRRHQLRQISEMQGRQSDFGRMPRESRLQSPVRLLRPAVGFEGLRDRVLQTESFKYVFFNPGAT